jgi:hypothetical protein
MPATIAVAIPSAHPAWCTRPPDEAQDESHVSESVSCNSGADEILSLSVQLYEYWPPDQHAGFLALQIVDDTSVRWYPLPKKQAQALSRAIAKLLCLANPNDSATAE